MTDDAVAPEPVPAPPPEPVLGAVTEPSLVEPAASAEIPVPEDVAPPSPEPVAESASEARPPASVPEPAPVRDQASVSTASQRLVPGAEGRSKSVATRAHKREQHFLEILSYAQGKPFITNDMVEKILHVSDATTNRYLTELVRRGKLVREGKGRGVKYKAV